eukprot:13909856-Alexandrium_andersonii.AAC.1
MALSNPSTSPGTVAPSSDLVDSSSAVSACPSWESRIRMGSLSMPASPFSSRAPPADSTATPAAVSPPP